MTSDAKIGLLLGLVFIFIVAFLINGLPSLRPPISRVDATTMTPPPDEDFRTVTDSTGRAVANWTDELEKQRISSEPAPTPVETPRPAVAEQPQPQPQPQPTTQTAGNEGVRSVVPLPGFDKLLNQLTPTLQKEQVSLDPPQPAPAAVAPEPRPEPVLQPRPTDPPAREADTQPLPRPARSPDTVLNLSGNTVYVVVSGDNLPAISKKMYGPEEGNRLANIERIYQANKDILESPAKVLAGQKLVIPPPLPPLPKDPTAAVAPGSTNSVSRTAVAPAPTQPAVRSSRPVDVLPKTLFEESKEEPKTLREKVDALSRKAPAIMPPPTPEGRWYTVQDGDSLWKIASSQLGAGSRWDEIQKLNADILANQGSLMPGMRLRLPAK